MPRHIMILGAGQYQLPLIQAARRMGLRTYVVGRPDGSPGIALADEFIPVDFTDYPAVLAAARRHGIDGVCSASTDLTVPIIGRLVDDLSLPGYGADAAFRTTNKVAMKRAFAAHGVPTGAFEVVASLPEARTAAERIGLPVMVKAVDSMGSQGITKVSDPGQLPAAWQRAIDASRCSEVLVEAYIEGLEFCVTALVVDGALRYAVPSEKIVAPPPYRATLGHMFPMACDEATTDRIRRACEVGMHALGIPTGHANIDFILDADGPKIIEIGARLGATCMPESFNVLTGADLFAEAIALALGEKPPPIRPAGQPNAARYITAPRPGVLRSIRVPEQTAEASDVVRLTLYAAPGDEVRPFQCASDRIGEVIVTAPTAADAGRRAEEIAGAIEMTFEQEPQP